MLKKILFFLLLFYIQFFIFIEFSLSRVNYFLNLNFKLFDIFIVLILFIVIVFILAIFLIPKGKFIVWVETELVLYILVLFMVVIFLDNKEKMIDYVDIPYENWLEFKSNGGTLPSPYKVEAITPHRVRIVFKMLGSENENKVQREKILHMTNSKQK